MLPVSCPKSCSQLSIGLCLVGQGLQDLATRRAIHAILRPWSPKEVTWLLPNPSPVLANMVSIGCVWSWLEAVQSMYRIPEQLLHTESLCFSSMSIWEHTRGKGRLMIINQLPLSVHCLMFLRIHEIYHRGLVE